ncbi:hypothetical protein HF1_13820 [Mycoplasma haemofelis str. Langford 1]|uniref:Uncharacterized protein n=1 Tax=Mycoplasma haemofelis (strain Langford 1) TaxID=941640 RepID=E8ZJR9_MYCHL|nr:hypothetical protein [Mycoplasma haemofelis]CBY93390.1 hypothetical protein HF1_13820 [Mycoplasma haemofelis str. Langford 1]
MSTLLKVALPTTAIGGAGSSYLIYDYVSNRKEILRDVLIREYSGKKYKVSPFTDGEWEEVKKVYKQSQNKVEEIGENDLPSWCEGKLSLFNDSKDVYENAKKWCVIKTSSVLEELGGKAISADDSAGNVDSEWLPAWKRYNDGKSSNSGLQINDEEFKKANDESKGKDAMKKWCGDVYKKFMYQEDAESALALASKWCVKPIS